jgi:SAM-dependent methyltransferase
MQRGRVPKPRNGVEQRFRKGAQRWDEIYSEHGRPLVRMWDRLTRDNVRWRFTRTFEEIPDLSGRSVLDLGCGSGRYIVEALARGAERVVGVDFAPEMLRIAARLLDGNSARERAEFLCEDVQRLVLRERFDLVIANGLFDYLAPAGPLIMRTAQWCRGVFVGSFPDKTALRAIPRRLYWRRRGVEIHAFDRAAIEQLATPANFDTYAVERRGPLYLLIALKSQAPDLQWVTPSTNQAGLLPVPRSSTGQTPDFAQGCFRRYLPLAEP